MKSSALLMMGLLLFSVFAVSTFSNRTGICDAGKDYEMSLSETENEPGWKFGRIQLNTTADGLVPLLETFTTVMESNTTDWDETGIGAPYVIYDSGLYKMWYGASSIPWVWPYIMGREVIAYAESNDGVTWLNKQVVHDSGAEQPAYYVTGSPWVIKEGGTYRMWHMDYYEYVAGDWSGYIAHMNSSDGVSWPAFMSADDQKVLSAQGQSTPQGDGYHISHACVIHEPSEYVMWYAVADHPQPGVGGPSKIWRATSTDGIAWANRQLSLPYIPDTWEGSIWQSSVVKEDDEAYTMFYTAGYTNGSYPSIGIAESIDGISWTNRTQLLKPSDLGANVTWLGTPFRFKDVDGKRYLYFTYYYSIPYDVTIQAYCYTEATEVSVSITMDGTPTGFNTPHTFTGLTGAHSFTVPDNDPNGHSFRQWNTGETSTTLAVTDGGTYTAYYGPIPDVAVTNVAPSKTVVGQGCSMSINVTVENQGDYTETFNVTAYYDETAIPTPEQWPTPDQSQIFWSVGDINKDGYVDDIDVHLMQSKPVDLNGDGKIDFLDVAILGAHYGLNIWTYLGIPGDIKNQTTVTLSSGNSTIITFRWNTTDVVKGFYLISAYAWPVPGETDTADNTLEDDTLQVTIAGDIYGDGIVDGMDLTLLASAWRSLICQPWYNPNADLNGDGEVDGSDLTIMGTHWGKHDP